RIRKLTSDLLNISTHAFFSCSKDCCHKRTADKDSICTKRQRLEYICTGTDSAVHENLHLSFDCIHNLRKYLCCRRTLIQHTSSMVGHNDCVSSCRLSLQRTAHRHDTFYDKRHITHADNLMQLFHGLASCRRCHVFQERKSGRIDIHGNRKCLCLLCELHLFFHCFQIPRLDCRNSKSSFFLNRLTRKLHHICIHTVSGHCCDPCLCTGRYKNIIVSLVIVLLTIMQIHCSYRACKKRVLKCLSEQLHGSIRSSPCTDRIHVYTDLLPFIIVADSCITHALGSRTRYLSSACLTIAARTCFAVLADTGTCFF